MGRVRAVAPGQEESDPPEGGLSTAQLAKALNVSRQTVNNWKNQDLLPAPAVLHLGARGKTSFWPAFALPLAQYVQASLQARKSVAQIARLVKPLLAKEPAWVDTQLAGGQTIEALLVHLKQAGPHE